MKKIIIIVILALYSSVCMAYDFADSTISGHLLYYSFNDDSTLCVVCPHNYTSTYYYNYNTTYTEGELIIPDSVYYGGRYYLVTSIGAEAFTLYSNEWYCDGWNITSITIPKYIRSIYYTAFYGCHNLRKIIWNAQHYSKFDFNAGPEPGYTPPNIDTLIIGEDVVTLPTFRWSKYNGTSSSHRYNYPRTLIFNARNAVETNVVQTDLYSSGWFRGLDSINRCFFGDEVTSLPSHFLEGCNLIDTLIIPNTIKFIGDSAFANCYNVTIQLPVLDSLEYVGVAAFKNCQNLFGTFQIPSSSNTISPYCYYNCQNVTGTFSIPESVVSIGEYAFAGCPGVTGAIVFPNNLQTLGEGCFYDCDNIISINTNTRIIRHNAFANCDRLISVTLGDSVKTLAQGSFNGCFRLQNIIMGSGIDTLMGGVFNGCVRLANMQLGSGIRHIGDSSFYNCSLIHDIVLPEGLASIGNYAFYGCNGISGMLEFPSTITTIGTNAFRSIGTVNRIRMNGITPPTIYANTFYSVSNSTPVEVPCGAVLNYYTTNYWVNFSNIVEAPPFRLTVTSNNTVMGTATVTQQTTCTNHTALIQATANSGYHFLQWNDGITANPRSIPMTQDSTFTAIFVVNNSYITVHANDSTMGSVSGTGLYGYNAPVTLTATAYSGYHFLRWSDGNTQNPRYLAAVRDSSFTAIFVSNVSTITVANANPDMGNVSGSGVYYYQNLVSLTATANYGYHFVQWNDGNTQNPRTILVSQDSAFTAFFALNTYSIVATSNSTTMGSVSGGGQYTYLHEMSMTATPAYGYHFVQWNDGVTDNPRTITVTRDSAFTAQFAANSYTLTVAPNDATMGSAYGAGSYNYNTTATLTAVPNYGYHFTQWSDAVTDNPRTVTVLNNATYTAQFEINSYTITVQSSNPAIGTTSGSGSYNYLTPVNITALPNVGYHFTQWSDGNMTNPRLISVTANATYTAQFAINSYAVGVTSNNSTMGSVSGSGTYNHNSTATLTATPYYGYHFVQWQDGNTQNPRTVVVTDSAQYTAQFDYNSYLVTALSSNVTLGTATGGGSYNYLSQVALTAVPAPHYHFMMWNDSIEDNPRTITVTRDTTLTAHFAIDRHTIGVNSANATQGTASGSSTVDYNTAVWISATPNYGYHFTQWNDGNSSNPRRVVVSQDTVFTASFAPNQYTATCMANDNSRGSVTTAGGSYNYLSSVTFTAVPNANYHFLRWSNGSTDNPITFTLTQDTALTAIFVGLTANVDDNTMGTASHTKTANLVEVVTATPNYGYHFVQWQDGNSDNPRTVALTQDTVLTAYFAVNTYYLTLVSNDTTMGTVSGSGSYNYLTQVTLTAAANDHHHFVQWNDGNTTNPRLITVTSDSTFIAQFEEDARYSITVSSNDTAMGTVAGSGSYYGGEQVVLTATPREHYHFVGWGDGNTQTPRTITVVGDADYTAVFEADIFTITVTANDPTMGSVMGGGEYGYGTEVTIAAQPFAGYGFRGWSDGDTNRERTIVVTGDADYQAIFYDMVGISDVEMPDYSVNVERNVIHIEGVSQRKIAVYDISGRRIAYIDKSPETFTVSVPATGVYLIQVEGMRARKVVVY